jgi:hypothetical protein
MNATLIIITILSLALAATASLLAWRVIRDDRRRSDARIAALAANVRGDAPVQTGELFEPASPHHGWSVGVLAAGVGVIAVIAFLMLFPSPQPSAATGDADGPAAASPSLQLVALDAIRSGDSLLVRGNVRNPGGGSRVAPVSVVVVGLGRAGQMIARAEGDLEPADLGPGSEAMFSVTMTDAGDVVRYRVGFRVTDRVVPHVDDRE